MRWSSYLVLILVSIILLGTFAFKSKVYDCSCDKEAAEQMIKRPEFNPPTIYYDTLKNKNFYYLPTEVFTKLWYREIQIPMSTNFTPQFWGLMDYQMSFYKTNPQPTNLEFITYFKDKQDIELVFKFKFRCGIHPMCCQTYIFRKLGCCFLGIKSDFINDRYVYKGYTIIDEDQMNATLKIIQELPATKLDSNFSNENYGIFIDNKNNRTFAVDFENSRVCVKINPNSKLESCEYPEVIKRLFKFKDKDYWFLTYHH